MDSSSEFLLRIAADYMVFPIVFLGGVVLLFVPKKARREVWGRAVITGVVALLFAKAASLLYQGERPFETMGVAPGAAFLPNPGFPSDHALLVFVVACVVWASTKNLPLTAFVASMAIVVAWGRVAALVHTPLDVLGGLLCALAAAVMVYGRRFFTIRGKYLLP